MCDGILKKPREVFLFGCNTTAGKSQDLRTPEEYTQVLMNDGFSLRQAEQISAFRYSPIGQETRDRMRQVFPHSRIYGFHSLAPSGSSIVPRLRDYFESVPDYRRHLERFPTEQENEFWSQAMRGQWIRSVDGSAEIENPICILEEDMPIYKKLEWVHDVLSDDTRSLAYIPVIDVYLRDLERSFFGADWGNAPSVELSFLERIQFNERGRERVDDLLSEPMEGLVSAQVQVLNFGQRVGWYDEEVYGQRIKVLLGGLFEENLDIEQKNMICSLAVELDLSLEDLPEESWNLNTIVALGCVQPRDVRVHQALVEFLKDTEPYVRGVAVRALGKIKPADSSIHQALVAVLKDTDPYVRVAAAWALGKINPADSSIHQALVESLEDPHSQVREVVREALEKIHTETDSLTESNAG